MNAAAWLARFEAAGDAWRAQRADYHRQVGAMIEAERAPVVAAPCFGVAFESAEIGEDAFSEPGFPDVIRHVWGAALGAGWAVRVMRAVGAVPSKGLVVTWSLRCVRHDERLIAVWWVVGGATSFNLGIYQGPASVGVERLGVETLESRVRAMAKAAREGRKIPAPLARRGVLDAINGVRLPS